MNYLTTLKEHEVILAFEGRYKAIDVKFVKCYLELHLWERAATKIPEKIKSVRFVSAAWLC
jgi:hypothetical protein